MPACRGLAASHAARPSTNGRRRDHAGADAALEVALHARGDGIGAAVGVEALDVEARAARRAPTGAGPPGAPWSAYSASCISQKRPCSAAASAAQAAAQARGCFDLHREVAERPARRARSSRSCSDRAVRALVVGVDDHQRRHGRSAGPVRWSSGPSGGSGALPSPLIATSRAAQRAASASKIRFAPGQLARVGRLVAPLHDPVGADHDERALRHAARVVDAERAARRALGLEVRELLDRDAELLLERLAATRSRRTRRRRASRPGPRTRRALPRRR